MANAQAAFEPDDGDIKDLGGYQEITRSIIFDVNLAENFRRKDRFVADVHKIKTPISVTYSNIVSKNLARMLLMIAAINGLDL